MLRLADVYMFSQLGEDGCRILGRQDNMDREKASEYGMTFISQVRKVCVATHEF
jgi:hypothetical protein